MVREGASDDGGEIPALGPFHDRKSSLNWPITTAATFTLLKNCGFFIGQMRPTNQISAVVSSSSK